MFALLIVFIVIICTILILIVLIQNPKGGGLSSNFTGGSAGVMGGVQQTTDFLEKSTWVLALSLMILAIVSTAFISKSTSAGSDEVKSKTEQLINNGDTPTPEDQ